MKIVAFKLKSSNKKIQKSFSEDSRSCSSMLRHEFQNSRFQPTFIKKEHLQRVLGNQWKEELELGRSMRKELAGKIKEPKLKYRFLPIPQKAVFSKNRIEMAFYGFCI